MIITIVSFVSLISIIVAVHEFGHYLFARLFGVQCTDFAIGFGKELIGFTDKNNTRWKICALPFGGYLKMLGDEDVTSFKSVNENKIVQSDRDKSILFKKPYQKCLIAFGGPFFNFILAFLIFLFIIYTNGVSLVKPIVGSVVENSMAQKIGIKINDEILYFDDIKINDFRDIKKNLIFATEKTHILTIKRPIVLGNKNMSTENDYQVLKLELKLNGEQKKTERMIGITNLEQVEYRKVNFINSIKESAKEVYNVCEVTALGILEIVIKSKEFGQVGGPLTIAKESTKAAEKGVMQFLYFIAFISINLGLVNLLPIPLLDGGMILINIIEMLCFNRKLPDFIYQGLSYIGYIIVGFLMFIGIFNDIKKSISYGYEKYKNIRHMP